MVKDYRSKQQVICEVLQCTESQISASSLTRKNNLNHSKLKNILGKLTSTNLVVKFENNYVITEKGRVYLEKWKDFSNLASSFGLEI